MPTAQTARPRVEAHPTAPSISILVYVGQPYEDRGSEVVDVDDRWVDFEEACRHDPNLARSWQINPPETRGDAGIDAKLLAQYQRRLASKPAMFSIRRTHGRTFRESGFWKVSGAAVHEMKVVAPTSKGEWRDREGTTWEGPWLTIDDARNATGIERPVCPTAHPAPVTDEILRLRKTVAMLERQAAENEEALNALRSAKVRSDTAGETEPRV